MYCGDLMGVRQRVFRGPHESEAACVAGTSWE